MDPNFFEIRYGVYNLAAKIPSVVERRGFLSYARPSAQGFSSGRPRPLSVTWSRSVSSPWLQFFSFRRRAISPPVAFASMPSAPFPAISYHKTVSKALYTSQEPCFFPENPYNVKGLLPSDMQTEIKSKYNTPIVFAGDIDSEGSGIIKSYIYSCKNDGYECKGPDENGYYYITEYIAPATGSNAIRRAMAASEAATASNADKDQNKDHAPAVSATASNAEKNTGVNQSSSAAASTSKEETKKPKLPVASAANAEKKEEGGKLPLKDTRPDPESSRSTENKRTEAIPAAAAAKSDSTGDGNGDGNADNGIKAGRKEEE